MDGLIEKYRRGEISGKDLASLQEEGKISKKERRAIVKKAGKESTDDKVVELSERQKLRRQVKEKKAQPRQRLSQFERDSKYSQTDKLERERLKEAANFVICLGCRKRGHYLKDCPKKTLLELCYNCGETTHALRDCPKPRSKDGKLPFASCFVCKKSGHITKDCPQNPNGLYPKGGCCHICLQKTHFVKDCPERTEEDIAEWKRQKDFEDQEKEDAYLGPRVKGLSENDGVGDEIGNFENVGDEEEDDDEEDGGDGTGRKRKNRKDKQKKKKKQRGL